MIAFVHGTAVDMTENSVIVEAGGIGYDIYMTGKADIRNPLRYLLMNAVASRSVSGSFQLPLT